MYCLCTILSDYWECAYLKKSEWMYEKGVKRLKIRSKTVRMIDWSVYCLSFVYEVVFVPCGNV